MRIIQRVTAGLALLALTTVVHADAVRGGHLVFSDGNRITGELVAEGVFASTRFGEVRFRPDEATFEPAPGNSLAAPAAPAAPNAIGNASEQLAQPVAPPASSASPNDPADKTPDAPWWRPWKFSVSGYLDHTAEGADQKREYHLNLHANRPRQNGEEFLFSAAYEYNHKNDKIDSRKATGEGEWRHDLGASRWFTLARGFTEYNGTNLNDAQAAALGRSRLNYLLVQAQGGLGYRLLDTPRLKTNVAGSWSLFYVEVFDFLNADLNAPSLLLENDLQLPWRFSIKQRGQVYHLPNDDSYGWENKIDLTRHLTDSLYLTLRHEYRENYPVGDANSLDRVRLLFGADF